MDRLLGYDHCLTLYSQVTESRTKQWENVVANAASVLSQRRDEHLLRPPTFNVFQALGHVYREVSTHSAMLAHLLDPRGGHAQNTLFLEAFLQSVQSAATLQELGVVLPTVATSAGWSCRREFSLGAEFGRVDILLRGPSLLLLIENKVHASDGQDQLRRYWNYARSEAGKDRQAVLIYLTLDGRQPSEGWSQSEGTLVRLSYRYDLHPMLEAVSRSPSLKSISVSEVTRQYSALIRDLT